MGQWTWIRIPIDNLGLGANPQISYFAIQSGNVGTAYFDEMRFEANTTLYEGVQGLGAPSVQRFSWGAVVTTPPSNGDYWLNVSVTQAWGGIQFYVVNKYAGTMPASDYTGDSGATGQLSVHFQKTVSIQTVNARLVGDNNVILGSVNLESYVPGGVAALNTWYRVLIPFSAFGVYNQNLTGVVFDSNVTGTFLIDEARFIKPNFLMNFNFPLTSGYSQGAYTSQKITSVLDHYMSTLYSTDATILSTTGEYFQATAQYPSSAFAPCYPKSSGAWSSLLSNIYIGTNSGNCLSNLALNYDGHPGYDYQAQSPVPVTAVAAGIVVPFNNGCVPKGIPEGCLAWGAVGIDHGNGYVSQYLHLSVINVSPGQVVAEGQRIGSSGNTSPPNKPVPAHFHFEVLKLRSGFPNDYQQGSYATVDPYGYNTGSGIADYLATQNSTPSVCLWKSGCRFQ